MNELKIETNDLSIDELKTVSGGHPVLVALGVITTIVSVGKALDQAGEWFMDGWKNPN